MHGQDLLIIDGFSLVLMQIAVYMRRLCALKSKWFISSVRARTVSLFDPGSGSLAGHGSGSSGEIVFLVGRFVVHSVALAGLGTGCGRGCLRYFSSLQRRFTFEKD